MRAQNIHMPPDTLKRFFASIPIVDRRMAKAQYDELAARLPRRGVVHKDVAALHATRRRFERVLAHREVRDLDPEQRNFLCMLTAAQARRMAECAHLIQVHALRWLYRPPNGPMVVRMAKEWGGDGDEAER